MSLYTQLIDRPFRQRLQSLLFLQCYCIVGLLPVRPQSANWIQHQQPVCPSLLLFGTKFGIRILCRQVLTVAFHFFRIFLFSVVQVFQAYSLSEVVRRIKFSTARWQPGCQEYFIGKFVERITCFCCIFFEKKNKFHYLTFFALKSNILRGNCFLLTGKKG